MPKMTANRRWSWASSSVFLIPEYLLFLHKASLPISISGQVDLDSGFEGWVGLAQEDMVQSPSRKMEYFGMCGGYI